MPRTGGAGQQRRTDHLGRIRPPHQHRDWQQHVCDQTRRAPGSSPPQHLGEPVHTTRRRPPPRAQHLPAARTLDLPGGQPRLDSNLISLYRHQRVPPRIQHGPPAAVFHDIRREGRRHLHRMHSSEAQNSDGADNKDQLKR
jgi:hypothetical protein